MLGSMWKLWVNPLLLLTAMLLFGVMLMSDTPCPSAETGVAVLCFTAFALNAVLALARGLTQRPALMLTVWSMVFLILGSGAWVYLTQQQGVSPETRAKYRAFEAEGRAPYAADAEGDCPLSLAAEMGQLRLLRRLLAQTPPTAADAPALAAAALRAAERGDAGALRALLEAGLPPTAPGVAEAAVNSGRMPALRVLLEAGADANAADAEGNTLLMNAALNGHPGMVRLLLEHGADAARCNAEGRDAASLSRSSAVDALLAAPAQP